MHETWDQIVFLLFSLDYFSLPMRYHEGGLQAVRLDSRWGILVYDVRDRLAHGLILTPGNCLGTSVHRAIFD